MSFRFNGDLSAAAAAQDPVLANVVERRLENYLDQLESDRRDAMCYVGQTFTVVHNTNTVPAFTAPTTERDPLGWHSTSVSAGRIIPNIPGWYHAGAWFNFSAGGFPAGSRVIGQVRTAGTVQGGIDLTGQSGSPDFQALTPRPVPLNGSTDYFDTLIYHFQGSGTTSRDCDIIFGVWLHARDESLAA